MKIFCFIISFTALQIPSSLSLDAICSYEHYRWLVVGQIYFCKVLNRLNIFTPDQAVIRDAEGTHEVSKTNDDVLGFYALNKSIEYFPKGIEKIFKNLKLINIQHGRIKEIHQADLMPHTKLEYLALWENDIEVIEDGLFDFNPELAYIYFERNKIFQIHPKAFDKIPKMTFLDLQSNLCIDMYAKNNPAALAEVIKEVKAQCTSLSIKNLFNHVKIINKKSTVALIKAANHEVGLKICQNSVVALNQKVENVARNLLLTGSNTKAQELESSNGKLSLVEQGLKHLELTVAVAKVENSGNFKALSDKTASLEGKLEKLQNDIKALKVEALQAQVDSIEKSIKAQEAETSKNFEVLQKALKDNEENLNSFKVEIFGAVEKVMEELRKSSESLELKALKKFNEMSESLKASQDEALEAVSEKFKSFEDGIVCLKSRMLESIQVIDESCDVE